MKKLLVFILILASKSIFACGFHPMNEEFRYCFLRPQWFDFKSYSEFYYSANSFALDATIDEYKADANELLWVQYCQNKVSFQSVREVMGGMSYGDIQENSKNEMIQYLYQIKDKEAIAYLKFAKNCEIFNSWLDDPWERNTTMILPQRTKLLKQAIQFSKEVKNKTLQKRYAFLAIRMAFYNQDFEQIRTLYDAVFQSNASKDILYYWSLYFRAIAEKDKALASFYAAQVFVNAPDKRFMVMQHFDHQLDIQAVLRHAKTNQEQANVYFLAAIKKHDKALNYIQKVYQLQPNFEGLDFILLREVNKLEDWILTPYYSHFEPSVLTHQFWDENKHSFSALQNRVVSDRKYAQQLLNFIEKVDLKKVQNQPLWQISRAYLHFLTQDYDTSLTLLNALKTRQNSVKENQHLDILRALVLTANQPKGEGVILEEVKTILLKNKNNNKLIFALGRELEYLGNTTDAALLYAKIDNYQGNDEEYQGDGNGVYWRNKYGLEDGYANFYQHYFDYINAIYTPEQVEELIHNILSNHQQKEAFSVYLYHKIKPNLSQLYDLVGTKYIRINHLSKALVSFKKVGDYHWNEAYSNWEKQENDWSMGSNVFDQNPFYQLKYTPSFIPVRDSIRLNKYTVTKQLIKYINKAEDPKEPNKDYFYFLVANCYYNMTFYGNSWMMRRYYCSSSIRQTAMVDDAEFYQCNSAKTYYKLALKNAQTDQFKALCLRMIGRCEKNKLSYQLEINQEIQYENYDAYLFDKNRYYQDLKRNYSKYFDDLMSDCSSFNEFFSARR